MRNHCNLDVVWCEPSGRRRIKLFNGDLVVLRARWASRFIATSCTFCRCTSFITNRLMNMWRKASSNQALGPVRSRPYFERETRPLCDQTPCDASRTLTLVLFGGISRSLFPFFVFSNLMRFRVSDSWDHSRLNRSFFACLRSSPHRIPARDFSICQRDLETYPPNGLARRFRRRLVPCEPPSLA